MQKKCITAKEIHENMVLIFAEDFPSYEEVLKDSTEDELQSVPTKISTTDEEVDKILRMVLDERCLRVQLRSSLALALVRSTPY